MRTTSASLPLPLLALAAAAAMLSASLLTSSAGAVTNPAPSVPGIVDIDTNLAYQDASAAGTGIVLTSTGEVLTNNHVIRGATSIRVTVVDTGKRYTAKIVGYDISKDVAVVQMEDASGLQTAQIGTSAGVKLGQAVTAYGNAGGVGGAPSVAPGKVIGLKRTITANDGDGISERLLGLIESDAPLQPGDSGGPLVDATGNVIGLDTAASRSFEFNSGTSRGYSVPIEKAVAVAAKIVNGEGSSTVHVGATAFMGVSLSQPDPYSTQKQKGLVIAQFVSGSPVKKAGLVVGDTLLAFDGTAVSTQSKLGQLVSTKAPGDAVQLRWLDSSGAAHTTTVVLVTGPPQ